MYHFSFYFFGVIFLLSFVIHVMKHGFRSFIGLSIDDILSEIFNKFNYFKDKYKVTKKKRYLFLRFNSKWFN